MDRIEQATNILYWSVPVLIITLPLCVVMWKEINKHMTYTYGEPDNDGPIMMALFVSIISFVSFYLTIIALLEISPVLSFVLVGVPLAILIRKMWLSLYDQQEESPSIPNQPHEESRKKHKIIPKCSYCGRYTKKKMCPSCGAPINIQNAGY